MKIHSLLIGFLAILSLAIAVFAGYQMSLLPLWGSYTFFLLAGGWTGLILLVISLRVPNTYSIRLLLLSIGSGILLAKGFVYTSPLLFIGFVPLLILQNSLDSEGTKVKWTVHGRYAFNAFMYWNIGATWWIANSALIPGIVAIILNSLLMTIPWIAMIQFGRQNPKLKYLGFIVFWICFEWIHNTWDLSWPWLTLGNGLTFMSKFIQWYDITGAYGGSLWILFINIFIFQIIIKRNFKAPAIIAVALWILIPALYSLYKYEQYIPKGEPVETGIVQINYEPHYEKFSIDPKAQMLKFEKLSKEACTQNTKYLIWPETSFEFIQTDQFESDWRIQLIRKLLEPFPALSLVAGMTTIKMFQPGEALTDAARESTKSTGESRFYEVQNAAIQINNTSKDIPVYVKSKLVPGAESFPYRNLLPFLKPIVEMLDGSVYGLGKQKERSIFQSGKYKIAPVICYESIYGNYIGDYIRKGAQAIFIMTNDGWWDDTPGYKQHLAFGALRAIEFRRPIARAANTGVSCFVDARGDILQTTQYGKDAAITGTLLFSNEITTYLVAGDIIAYSCIYLAIAFIIWACIIFLKARFSKNQ